jgi:precorrin-6B methylase 2
VPRRPTVGRLLTLAAVHERLLADQKRNRAFTAALRRVVTRGARVVDLGAGSGVWAVTAARLGAARVVAVEEEPLLAPVIRAMARENGVADRVEVVTARSTRAALPREFDLVVSETVGVEAFDEDIVPILADARRRFLKPGGAVVPQTLSLMAAPARTDFLDPAGVIVETRHWETLLANFAGSGRRVRLLGRPVRLQHADLRTLARLDRRAPLAATWDLKSARTVNAIALWADMQLAPGVSLSTRVGTSWPPVVLPVGPFQAKSGRLEVQISHTGRIRTWRATLRSGRGVETQDASPLFAYGALRAHMI